MIACPVVETCRVGLTLMKWGCQPGGNGWGSHSLRHSSNANPRGKHLTALGTIIFSILVPGTWTVLIPYLLIASNFELFPIEIGPLRFLGLFPITVGIAFYLWCAWGFTFLGKGTPAPIAPPKTLVIKGLYRHVRNPMYVGVLLILFGEALLFESATLFLYAVTRIRNVSCGHCLL